MIGSMSLEAVTHVYEGPPAVTALRDVTLRIGRGDFVAVTGASGSGKSTLLNVLGLLDAPKSGHYWIDETDVLTIKERERAGLRAAAFGFVFQAYHLLTDHTALENVELGMLYRALPRSERAERSQHALERVGLSTKLDSMPTALSGGEQQRVAIARALAGGAHLLLCDEPTGNLDSDNSSRVLDLLEDLNASGITVVIVTHDASVAQRTRRVVHMRDGQIDEQGTT